MSDRKLWHGIRGSVDYTSSGAVDPESGCGKPVRNPIVIRALAIEASKNSGEYHTRFVCPICKQRFLAEYGRRARVSWPQEYEMVCLDDIRDLNLEKEDNRYRYKRPCSKK